MRFRIPAKAALGCTICAAAIGVPAGPAHAVDLDGADMQFIFEQIQRAEAHAAGGQLAGPGANQIGSPLLPYGLRTVDGSYNNIVPGQEQFGAADRVFPRHVPAVFKDAEPFDGDGAGPGAPFATSYSNKLTGPANPTNPGGIVADSHPRVISNLIVDQTASNPAAVAVAAERGILAPADPKDSYKFPNTAPDVGLSAPFNSWFTLFGQFFDHGLDLTTKGGSGTVIVPLKADDPLLAGPDGTPGNADDPSPAIPASQRFMVLTRATNQKGPDNLIGTADDVQEHTNTTTPFVDQNQTYTSHPSHQAFLREYENNADGRPVATGRLLERPDVGGLATWKDIKDQARTLLGIELSDADVMNVPLVKTDQYGKFIPGPNGLPQLVTGTAAAPTFAEGSTASPLATTDAQRTNHAFLDDIAHAAVPVGALTNSPGGPRGNRAPDANDTISTAADPPPPPSEYDNELLERHYITGDGRGNENIGLTTVHHVFHAEHNLKVQDIKDFIDDGQPGGPELTDWQISPGVWDGERLFQAARFSTEMQYQHLVFEEFARKVQPQVNVFLGYEVEVDPAITAEFAHVVYRFGHSMLDESVDRRTAAGTDRNIGLIEAFLNPVAFDAGAASPNEAAGDIVRGMVRQTGNEIDEFVTGALRSNLLGLPLDLAAINIARGRDTGVPSLNAARRSFYNQTGNSSVQPYDSWTDFRSGLRNKASLVNFVAAYGTHASITDASTNAAKRAAAEALVTGTTQEAQDFMNGPASTTGMENVDFWIGGLAEKQAPFGGLLGSSFNFVFETQMEALQNGDRLYYLTRTAGLNFLNQLESNSFAEIIERTTGARHLPADVFSRPDFTFEVGNTGTGSPVTDDPGTDYLESELLTRINGQLRFGGAEHVVFGGTDGDDNMRSSEGDDTLHGDGGNDRLEGEAGNDVNLGGDGNDIITDTFGDDNFKGGVGDDVIGSGPGFDLLLAGPGKDFTIGGADPSETFAGAGDDFLMAGDDHNTVFGNEGNDWVQGGPGADLLQGDNGAPFQDGKIGDDVIVGDGGNDDYDSEGGDDVMVAGPGIERNEGMLGFDWVTHRNEAEPVKADMNFTGLLPPDLDNIVDRFDNVEGLSGHNKDDILRGDDADATTMIEHEMNNTALIEGIDSVIGAVPSFTGGNIILGGDGSDTIEGRAGNDVIDGDRWLRVQIVVRSEDGNSELRRVDSMTEIQGELFAGTIKPSQLHTVRTIENPATPTGTDTAEFSGERAEYDITTNPDGTTTVTHARPVAPGGGGGGGAAFDTGVDTLRNVERLVFAGETVPVAPNASVTPAAGRTFPGQIVGTNSTAQLVALTNTGGSPLTITGITFAGNDPGDFAQTNDCGPTLDSGESCTISTTFRPTVTGARSATMVITHNANGVAGSTTDVPLTGTGLAPTPAASAPASADFGDNNTGGVSGLGGVNRTITVTSSGTAPLNIGTVTINPNSTPSNYTVTGGSCENSTRAPGATCTITVNFRATGTTGARDATLRINHNGAAATTVALTGRAVATILREEVPAAAAGSQANAPQGDAAPLRAGTLTLTRSRLRPLTIATNVPSGAKVVEIKVLRLHKGKNGGVRRVTLAKVYRKSLKGGRHTFRLTRKELRTLKPGRYQVSVRIGKTRANLGPAVTRLLTVKPVKKA